MNNIRQLAHSFTAKKWAYRQSRDGFVLSLLLAEKLPDAIAVADLGTPYMIGAVEIDENDQPIPQQPAKEQPAPVSEPLPARVAAVQRAGYLCKDTRFQKFLQEEFAGGWKLFNGYTENDGETATKFVRWRCGVKSRSEIKTNDDAFVRWRELDAAYQAWLRE